MAVVDFPEKGSKGPKLSFAEVGNAGRSAYSSVLMEDYNPDLRGFSAIETYDKMRRNDAKVRATLRIMKMPLLSGQWYIDGDDEASRFLWWALNNMSRSFVQMFYEILSFLDFGFYPFELVYEMGEWEGKEVVKWRKWAPRHPRTVVEWVFDGTGGLQGFRQQTDHGDVLIPIDKMLMFVFDEEGGSPEGMSVLRSAYQNWYFKENLYKVDAIQKERHGIGVPRVKMGEQYSPEDLEFAREMAKNLRTNEESFIIQLPNMEVDFVQYSGTPIDVLSSIEHHDLMIASNVLAQFLNLGAGNSGSRAISESQQEMFTRSIRYVGDLIRAVINKWAVPKLMAYNGYDERPELKVRRIGEAADWRSFSVAIRNIVEPGVLTADSKLETFVREIMDLPQGGPDVLGRSVEDRLPANKKKGAVPNAGPKVGQGKSDKDGSRTGGPKD